jgi:hypothetical protein
MKRGMGSGLDGTSPWARLELVCLCEAYTPIALLMFLMGALPETDGPHIH